MNASLKPKFNQRNYTDCDKNYADWNVDVISYKYCNIFIY